MLAQHRLHPLNALRVGSWRTASCVKPLTSAGWQEAGCSWLPELHCHRSGPAAPTCTSAGSSRNLPSRAPWATSPGAAAAAAAGCWSRDCSEDCSDWEMSTSSCPFCRAPRDGLRCFLRRGRRPGASSGRRGALSPARPWQAERRMYEPRWTPAAAQSAPGRRCGLRRVGGARTEAPLGPAPGQLP